MSWYFFSVFTGQTLINEQLIAWMIDISDKITQLDDKIDFILKNQEKLLLQSKQVTQSVDEYEDFEILGSLPCTDDSSFVELNKKIAEDNNLRQLLVRIRIIISFNVLKNKTLVLKINFHAIKS